MTDAECEELLRLLYKYATEYPESASSAEHVVDIVEDLAMSMDITTDNADRYRREITAIWS